MANYGDKFQTWLGELPTETPVQSTKWRKPANARVEEVGGEKWICWSGGNVDIRHGAAQEGLLLTFIRLADAEPKGFASYASKWGPLGLCHHDLPSTHVPRQSSEDLKTIDAEPCWPLKYLDDEGPPVRERVETWRKFASQASATHEAANLIRHGERVPDSLWERVRDLIPKSYAITDADFVEAAIVRAQSSIDEYERFLLELVIRRWLRIGDVGVHVHWDDRTLKVRYGGTGLAGALALQLALTTTSTGAFYTCFNCNTSYIPEYRRPREGENNYCEDCRAAGAKNRSRAYRQRRKAEREKPVILNERSTS